MHRVSLSSLSIGLLGAGHRMMIIVVGVHLMVTRWSSFGVFSLCMGFAMVQVIPRETHECHSSWSPLGNVIFYGLLV